MGLGFGVVVMLLLVVVVVAAGGGVVLEGLYSRMERSEEPVRM